MELYDVTGPEQTILLVFAHSYDEAALIYTIWWATNRRSDPPDCEIRQRNANWPGLNTALLREAISAGVTGIGHFVAGQGWRVVPADHLKEDA